ncbi:unnamed protein product, partial [Symbiodinium pilosum]
CRLCCKFARCHGSLVTYLQAAGGAPHPCRARARDRSFRAGCHSGSTGGWPGPPPVELLCSQGEHGQAFEEQQQSCSAE